MSRREAIVGRLQAIARAQEFVAAGKSGGRRCASWSKASSRPLRPAPGSPGRPSMPARPFAQMFALVIHELATNAAKYGSLSQPSGHVVIRLEDRPGGT